MKKRSLRYRAWHRAAKRGVDWAVEHFKQEAFWRLYARLFYNATLDAIYKENPLLKLIPASTSFHGPLLHIPLSINFPKRKRANHRKNNLTFRA